MTMQPFTTRQSICPLISICVAAATILGGCGKGGGAEQHEAAAKPTVAVSVASVDVGDIRGSISVTGALAPLAGAEAKVAPLAAGRIKDVFVKLGSQVRQGQPIATLDPATVAGVVKQAEAAVKVSTATLTQARVNFVSQVRSRRSAVQQAELNLEAQRVALVKLRAGSRPQEIAQAQAAVASAEASLTNALQNMSRSRTLFSQGLLARKDLEAAELQQKTAQAALTSARQALSLTRQGSRPEDIRAGEVAVRQAEQQLDADRAQAIQNAAKAQDVRIASGQLQSAQGALEAARSQTRSLTILSPVSGTVVSVGVNPGESVDVTAGVATVVNLDRVRVLLNVPADAASEVEKGMAVSFAVEGGPLHAAVVTVVARAVDPATNTVQVEALADNADRTLRDDGFARARIYTHVHRGVVVIPASALVEKDGKTTVFLAGEDGSAQGKAVKVGAKEGEKVEILSGLKKGDRIVTSGAYELDDGTKIKIAK